MWKYDIGRTAAEELGEVGWRGSFRWFGAVLN